MAHTDTQPSGFHIGYLAIAFGLFAMLLAVIHIFGGPFAPQQPVGVSMGEIAGEMRASAWRALIGAPQPAPEPQGWDIDRILRLAAPIVGLVAMALAVVSIVRHEPARLARIGGTLGAAAIVFQFIWWIAVLIAVVALITSLTENFGEVFGGLLGGIGAFFAGLFGGIFGG